MSKYKYVKLDVESIPFVIPFVIPIETYGALISPSLINVLK